MILAAAHPPLCDLSNLLYSNTCLTILYNSSFIGKAKAKNKGKISRYLANKLAMCARIDYFSNDRFDEYGNRLSDQINIETLEGMTIQIVDPEHYGEFYLEFQGIVTDLFKK